MKKLYIVLCFLIAIVSYGIDVTKVRRGELNNLKTQENINNQFGTINPIDANGFFLVSRTYKIEDDIVKVQESALSGNTTDAERLYMHYAFYIAGDKVNLSYIWLYVGAICGDKKVANILISQLKDNLKKNNLDDVILFYEKEIDALQNKNDLLSNFILYKYYTISNNTTKIKEYMDKLLRTNIDHRLLKDYKFENADIVESNRLRMKDK